MKPFFTSLPETLWAEVNRRLRVEPALWALANADGVMSAFVSQGGDLTRWRPGPLALLAESELQGSKDSPELVQAASAALALREKYPSARDYAVLAAESRPASRAGEAAKDVGAWALALVCLYGLLPDPQPLVAALLDQAQAESDESLAELVARMWAANESPAALADITPPATAFLAVNLKIAIAKYFLARGLTVPAQAVASANAADPVEPVEETRDFRALAGRLDSITLAEIGGRDSTHAALGRAIEAAQSLTADLALRLGHLTLAKGDPVSALAAFREAKALRPHTQIESLIAEARLACGDESGASVELSGVGHAAGDPRAQLAAARVNHKLGRAEQAHAAATLAAGSNEADVAASAADLLLQLGRRDEAASVLARLIESQPANLRAHLARAKLMLDPPESEVSRLRAKSGDFALHPHADSKCEAALDAAWQSVGLAPENAEARALLAEALARAGNPGAAIEHWHKAIASSEGDTSPLRIKLAETALAADQPALALATAQTLLDDPTAAATIKTGRAHIIAGQAHGKLGQHEQAFEFFNQATALAPDSALSWRAVATHHRERGDLPRALAALNAGRQAVGDGSAEAAELYSELGELHGALNQPADAIAAFEKAAKILPQRASLHRRLGELHRAQKHLPAAIEAMRRAATLAADDPDLWHALGQTLEAAGQWPEALAAYQHAQAAGGDSVVMLCDLGRLAYQLGDVTTARSALEEAARRQTSPALASPSDPALPYTLLGAIYEQSADHAAALAAYKHAIALEPSRSDLSVRLGLCCLALGQPEAAIAALRDVAERDLDNLALQQAMGQAYASAQLWDEALLALEQASRLAPDDPHLLQELANAARRAGNKSRAADALRQAVELAPGDVNCLRDLADLLAADGKHADARTLYLEAHKAAPDSAAVLMGLGQVHLTLNETREAAKAFEQAAALDPNRAEVWQALGETQAQSGNVEAAHASFLRASERESANPLHLRRAGECAWQLGRQSAAVALWQKVLLNHPNDAPTHSRLGKAYAEQGRQAESSAAHERAAEAQPSNVEFALEAARAAARLRDHARAASHLERATQLAPRNVQAWRSLGEACRAQNKMADSLAALDNALELAPDDVSAHAARAGALAALGRMPEALVSAEAALDSDDAEALVSVSDIFIQANKHAEATQACLKAVESRPDDAAAQLALARALTLESEARHGEHGERAPLIHRERLMKSLERAAALGADPGAVREWAGRARALFDDPAEAAPLLQAAAAARPSADLFRQLAHCYRRLGKLPLAREAIAAALDVGARCTRDIADEIRSYLEMGQICLAQQDLAPAQAAFKRALLLDNRNALAHKLLADTMISAKKPVEAVALYRHAVELEPEQAAWHFKLGELHEARGESSEALAQFQRAAALAKEQSLPPAETAAYLATLARAYARDGDHVSALDHFESALTLRDDVAEWWRYSGETSFVLRDYELALSCFNRAWKLAPRDTAARVGAARAAIALGREREAEENAMAVLRLEPNNTQALVATAELCASRGEYSNAVNAYARAALSTHDPHTAREIFLAQAQLLRTAERREEAIAVLQQMLEQGAADDETIGLLGDVLAEVGRRNDALEAYQQAARIAPGKVEHHVRLGRLCRTQGQLDAALGHLQRAQEFGRCHPEVLRETGQVFASRHQFDRAFDVYEELIALEPDCDDHYYRAGMALKSLRDYSEAARHFQRAAELNPENVDAERQRLAVSALGLLNG